MNDLEEKTDNEIDNSKCNDTHLKYVSKKIFPLTQEEINRRDDNKTILITLPLALASGYLTYKYFTTKNIF